ncbi:MAG: 4-alpha-glucanotransferase, partial [Candidatus Omnitrophota bacterium]
TYDLGFTFSFPVNQIDIDKGISTMMSKGFTVKGIVGEDVVALLRDAFKRKGVNNVNVVAIDNDTTGTQVARAYMDTNTSLGVILGTGTNICARLPMEAITKEFANKDKYKASHMIVNMESGNFDKNLNLNKYDELLDSQSTNKGEHFEEKMVSGLYLGELMRITLLELINQKQLFLGKTPWILKKAYQRFETKHVSDIESLNLSKRTSIWKLRWLMKKLILTRKDAETLQLIANLISTRSARVAASLIVGALQYIDPNIDNKHTVAIDGTVFEKHYRYQERMHEAFRELLSDKAANITTTLTHDGSGVGAAIIGAVASKAQMIADRKSQMITDKKIQMINKAKETQLALASSAAISYIRASLAKPASFVTLKLSAVYRFIYSLLFGLRSSGILMHITSLPSKYGIGDLGPEAYRFVNFLYKTGQRYWQILPLTVTNPSSGNSPYSSDSAFAVNTLFISPEKLAEEGWLLPQEIEGFKENTDGDINYKKVTEYKNKIFNLAWQRFQKHPRYVNEFKQFKQKNAYWLNDYALFVILKETFNVIDDKDNSNDMYKYSWNNWPKQYKDREPEALKDFGEKYFARLEEVKFKQFLVFKQWQALKAYAKTRGIYFIGDAPIYVTYDSSDTWTHQDFFQLDKEGKMIYVSGVPPDFFSATGQRWGNPVYNWPKLKETNYEWWLNRLKATLKLVDMIRIDHFRGFVQYWRIPASEPTAVKGDWIDAADDKFFRMLKNKLPRHSVIAEDLGVITPDVKAVMQRFKFPGMKILQFAFGGKDLSKNPYIPENYTRNNIVYTGTHDNNTTRGWYLDETDEQARGNISRYLKKDINSETINWDLIDLAMRSKANTAIIPIQDIIGLDSTGRMNKPGIGATQWQWRMMPNALAEEAKEKLRVVAENSSRAKSERKVNVKAKQPVLALASSATALTTENKVAGLGDRLPKSVSVPATLNKSEDTLKPETSNTFSSQLTSLALKLSIPAEALTAHLLSSLIPQQLVVDVAEAGGRVTADVVNELKAYPALSHITEDIKASQPKKAKAEITVDALFEIIAKIAGQQKVSAERMTTIFVNSIEPTVFIEGLAKMASNNTKEITSTLKDYPSLALIATTYRLQHLDNEATGKQTILKAEDVINPEALKYMEDTAKISLTFPEGGLTVDSGKWQAVKDHLDAVANDTAKREYNYRSNVLKYFINEFIPKEAIAYAGLIQNEFIAKGNNLKYIISSGIGANEMFSHLLANLHNAFDNSGVKWIVVDAPADLRLIPSDANNDNTIVIEFSRSGGTQETLKVAELTQKRFTKRIVYANKGPLKELALKLQKQGKPVIIHDLESTIGGRLMRRLTPMTYGPMVLAGMDPITYVASTDSYDKALDFKNKDKSLAVALARFFFVWVVLGNRREINVMYNQPKFLRHSLYELRQFVMEGANKKSSYPLIAHMNEFPRDPHVSMEGVFGQANSQIAFAVVAKKSGFPEDETILTEEEALNKEHAGLSINDMEYSFAYPNVVKSQKQMPTAYIEIEKMTPEVAAGLSSLYEDFIVHYCALTGQDPNSNPQVKAVREGTAAALIEMAAKKRESEEKDAARIDSSSERRDTGKSDISSLEKEFELSASDMKKLISSFKEDMKLGLSGNESSLAMLPTFVDNPTGKEKGKFLALD